MNQHLSQKSARAGMRHRLFAGLREATRRVGRLLLPEICHFCKKNLEYDAPAVTTVAQGQIVPEFPPAFLHNLENDAEYEEWEAVSPAGVSLCSECMETFRPTPVRRCRFCGMKDARNHRCMFGEAAQEPENLGFDRVIPLGDYRQALREAVLRMKLPRNEGLTLSLARLFAFYFRNTFQILRPDFIIPVPMHWLMKIIRRTNSPEIFAETLGKTLSLPVLPRLIRYNRLTHLQRSLNMDERRSNVAGCFSVQFPFPENYFAGDGRPGKENFRKIFKGRRILLVDDVLTTGATCAEICRVLKTELGVSYVAVVVFARARGDKNTSTMSDIPEPAYFLSESLGEDDEDDF